jgi:hypothetical protein
MPQHLPAAGPARADPCVVGCESVQTCVECFRVEPCGSVSARIGIHHPSFAGLDEERAVVLLASCGRRECTRAALEEWPANLGDSGRPGLHQAPTVPESSFCRAGPRQSYGEAEVGQLGSTALLPRTAAAAAATPASSSNACRPPGSGGAPRGLGRSRSDLDVERRHDAARTRQRRTTRTHTDPHGPIVHGLARTHHGTCMRPGPTAGRCQCMRPRKGDVNDNDDDDSGQRGPPCCPLSPRRRQSLIPGHLLRLPCHHRPSGRRSRGQCPRTLTRHRAGGLVCTEPTTIVVTSLVRTLSCGGAVSAARHTSLKCVSTSMPVWFEHHPSNPQVSHLLTMVSCIL